MSRTDLLIAGAGPAGSTLAILAAEAGLRVTLVEAKPFPRGKVCGEFVSAEGVAVLDRLGLRESVTREGATSILDCRISDRDGRCLDLPLPAAATGFSRSRMDTLLLERAAAKGVRILQPCRVRKPQTENGSVRGVEISWRRGAAETIRATAVVAADGRRSALLRAFHPRLGDPARTDGKSYFGLKAHWSRVRDEVGGRVDLHLFDGGYVGLGAVEQRRINLCMLVRVEALAQAGKSADRLVEQAVSANPAFLQAIGAGQRCSAWQSVGPLRFGARRPFTHGMFLVGDAAGTIDPFCGEGISNALLGAELLAPFAVRTVESGETDEKIGLEYAQAWRRRFGGVTRRVRAIGWGFAHPGLAGGLIAGLRGVAAPLAPRLLAATRTGFAENR